MAGAVSVDQDHSLSRPLQLISRPGAKHSRADNGHVVGIGFVHFVIDQGRCVAIMSHAVGVKTKPTVPGHQERLSRSSFSPALQLPAEPTSEMEPPE
jgi:hypothetical protein